jgi:RNA polymerase sigma-70 factor (ECF subfamily)
MPLLFMRGATGGAFALLDRVVPRQEELTPSLARANRVRAIVDEHFGFVWRYLRGLGVPAADADDAAQQVFVVASQKIDAIAVGSERSFLVGTARGVAANARRGATRRRESLGDDDLDALPDASPDAEARAGTQEELLVLDRFLASLPDDVRDVFILFELEGLTRAAIAESLSLPPGTVASRLRRAREAFQEMVKRYGASRGRRGP